jgi:hypothetical protein
MFPDLALLFVFDWRAALAVAIYWVGTGWIVAWSESTRDMGQHRTIAPDIVVRTLLQPGSTVSSLFKVQNVGKTSSGVIPYAFVARSVNVVLIYFGVVWYCLPH